MQFGESNHISRTILGIRSTCVLYHQNEVDSFQIIAIVLWKESFELNG